jgi:phthalate 4,5-dioxygenase oxygenase subunit
MLSAQDNETLVRVGEGTPMGNLIRSFWIPALLSSEVETPDGTPARVRLLGEDLVAFRDTQGRVGLLGERCPHRRASLALGVNEECGLRCLYHGWKFDVEGRCVDTPTEPDSSTMKSRIRAKAYPTREAGGVVWTYMGPAAQQPAFPIFEWFNMPSGHAVPFKVMEDCNYAQAVEGTIDSAHAGILHRHVPWSTESDWTHERDLRPKLEVEYTKYGLRYGAVRQAADNQAHVRVTQVVLPFYTLIPPDGFGPRGNRRLANAFVPRDDYSTWHIQWFFDATQPIDVTHRIDEGGLWLDEKTEHRQLVSAGPRTDEDRLHVRHPRRPHSGPCGERDPGGDPRSQRGTPRLLRCGGRGLAAVDAAVRARSCGKWRAPRPPDLRSAHGRGQGANHRLPGRSVLEDRRAPPFRGLAVQRGLIADEPCASIATATPLRSGTNRSRLCFSRWIGMASNGPY